MLRSLLAWLDDHQAGEAPSAALRAILGVLAFMAVFGLLAGSATVKTIIAVVALIILSWLVLVLLTDRRSLRQDYESHQRLVSHYCDFIYEKLHAVPQIVSWRQTTKIDQHGNTKETIIVRAKTFVEDTQFFRLRIGPGWHQPQRYRRRVRVNVRSLSIEGTPGTRLEITSSWLTNGKLDMIAHLHEPPKAGSDIVLSMDWDWPGKSIPLMIQKVPDLFVFEFGKSVPYATQTIILPLGHDAYYEPIGFSHGQVGYSLARSETDEGQVQFVFEAQLLPEDHKAGMRLELRGRDGLQGQRLTPSLRI